MFLHIDGTDETYCTLSFVLKLADNVLQLVNSLIEHFSMH